jgi:hypothetical protein
MFAGNVVLLTGTSVQAPTLAYTVYLCDTGGASGSVQLGGGLDGDVVVFLRRGSTGASFILAAATDITIRDTTNSVINTLTFSSVGNSCQLMYSATDSAWFMIAGNFS